MTPATIGQTVSISNIPAAAGTGGYAPGGTMQPSQTMAGTSRHTIDPAALRRPQTGLSSGKMQAEYLFTPSDNVATSFADYGGAGNATAASTTFHLVKKGSNTK